MLAFSTSLKLAFKTRNTSALASRYLQRETLESENSSLRDKSSSFTWSNSLFHSLLEHGRRESLDKALSLVRRAFLNEMRISSNTRSTDTFIWPTSFHTERTRFIVHGNQTRRIPTIRCKARSTWWPCPLTHHLSKCSIAQHHKVYRENRVVAFVLPGRKNNPCRSGQWRVDRHSCCG